MACHTIEERHSILYNFKKGMDFGKLHDFTKGHGDAIISWY